MDGEEAGEGPRVDGPGEGKGLEDRPGGPDGGLRASVVIPTYNRADLLLQGLRALAAQDLPAGAFEVVVVDDGSADGTEDAVRAWTASATSPAVRLFRQPRRGPAAARNRGAREARGRVVVFTDDDCEPRADWLREMLAPFDDPAGRVAAVKGAYATRQDSVVARFAQKEFESRYRRMDGAESVDFVDTYAGAFLRDVFLGLGGFDTRFPLANNEDVEFSYRMAAHGHRMVFNPRAVVYHRHPATLRAYLKTKFGRAYWRMAVYKAFPEKMVSDSYTPQTLKLQILFALALALLAGLAVWRRGLLRWTLPVLALFGLTAVPFLLLVLDWPWMNRRTAALGRAWRRVAGCEARRAVRRAGRAAALGAGRLAASLLRPPLQAVRAVVRAPRVRRVLRTLARGVRAFFRGLFLGAASVLGWLVRLPLRLAAGAARGLVRAVRALGRAAPSRGLARLLRRLARTRPGMAAASLVLLLLRGLVMGLGTLWGLPAHRSGQARFTTLLTLVLADAAAVVTACLAADYATDGIYRLFAPEAFYRIGNHMRFVPIFAVFLMGLFFLSGLYRPRRGISLVNEFVVLTKAVFTAAVTAIVLIFIADVTYSKTALALTLLLVLVLVPAARGVARALLRRTGDPESAEGHSRVLIVGTQELSRLIAARLEGVFGADVTVLGHVTLDPAEVGGRVGGRSVVGRVDELSELIEGQRIDEVFVALPMMPQREVLDLVSRHSRREGVHFHVVANTFDLIAAEVDMSEHGTIPTTYLRNENLAVLQVLIKRAFDVAVSAAVLLLSLPFWLLIMAAIKLETDGPALFRQERAGRSGRPFRIYKFRTMYADTPRFDLSPSRADDRRITRVGRFLRRTSLDEFPQFCNVLRGEMSLVGPRPEMPFLVERYTDWQRQRLSVKPGITGLWQIMGRKDLPLHESLEYDFYYIKNQSLLLDLSILIRTVPVVLTGRGAY